MIGSLIFNIPFWYLMNELSTIAVSNCLDMIGLNQGKNNIDRISSNIVSSYHACKGLKMMFSVSDNLFILRSDPYYDHIIAYSVSYFIYDILNDLWKGTSQRDTQLHHILSISVALYLYSIDLSQLYVSGFFVEMSTIPLNIKSILEILDMKETNFYFYNGLCFSVVFFFARILYAPLYLSSATSLAIQKSEISSLPFDYMVLVFPLIFATLNCYWFTKIVRILSHKYKEYNKIKVS